MMDFSDLGIDLNVEEVDERCDRHGIRMIKFRNRVMCPECAKELTKKREEELVADLTDKYFERHKKYIHQSVIGDKTLNRCTLANYEVMDAETNQNKQKAISLVMAYLNGESFNCILTGKAGTGKSHLAMAIVKEVNEKSNPYRKCLFVSVDVLVTMLRDSYNNPEAMNEFQIKNLCIDADVLVLDDLGAEVGAIGSEKQASNDVVRLINAIINGRMEKPTIFTTNLNARQLKRMYDDRIVSRMLKGVSMDRILKFEKTKDKRNELDF